MNKDQVKGRVDQATGKVKEELGDLTDKPDLENEGVADQVGGKARAGVGDAKEKVKDGIDKL